MCQTFSTTCPGSDLAGPAHARRFAGDRLRAEVGAPEAEDAIDSTLLVVSELVTNAIRAGCSTMDINVDVRRDAIRIEVVDDATGLPAMREARPEEETGRGLALIASVSAGWGFEPRQQGKAVWAEIALPRGIPHATPCPE